MGKYLVAGVVTIAVISAGVYVLISAVTPKPEAAVSTGRDEVRPGVPEPQPVSAPPSSDKAMETAVPLIRRGAFEGVSLHTAQGSAAIMREGDRYVVRLDDNFSVTAGPDLYVSLGKDGTYVPETLLAPLKNVSGGQTYPIPDSVDASRYDEVWIWCKAFSVGFGKAELR